MMRNIYLEGELGDRYGRELSANVDSVRDAFRLIDANYPDFKAYLVSCHEKNIGFTVDVAGKAIEKEEDLIFPIQSGDIVISPIPAGSKSGGAQILAAIAIIVITAGAGAVWAAGGLQALGGGLGALQAGFAAAMTTKLGLLAVGVAINLAITGIQQLMAPDPATDRDEPASYMFNGSEQNIIEGDPVPILYGELRVPGRPIAFSVVNNSFSFVAGFPGVGGGAGTDSSAAPGGGGGTFIDYSNQQEK